MPETRTVDQQKPNKPSGQQLTATRKEREEGWVIRQHGGMEVKVLDIDRTEHIHISIKGTR